MYLYGIWRAQHTNTTHVTTSFKLNTITCFESHTFYNTINPIYDYSFTTTFFLISFYLVYTVSILENANIRIIRVLSHRTKSNFSSLSNFKKFFAENSTCEICVFVLVRLCEEFHLDTTNFVGPPRNTETSAVVPFSDVSCSLPGSHFWGLRAYTGTVEPGTNFPSAQFLFA